MTWKERYISPKNLKKDHNIFAPILSTVIRDVTIQSTHDSILISRFDSRLYLNKMRFKTNYKLNVSFYYCLDKMLLSNVNWIEICKMNYINYNLCILYTVNYILIIIIFISHINCFNSCCIYFLIILWKYIIHFFNHSLGEYLIHLFICLLFTCELERGVLKVYFLQIGVIECELY